MIRLWQLRLRSYCILSSANFVQKDPSEQTIILAQKCLHNSVETNPYHFKSKNPGHHYYDSHITRGTACPGRKWQLAVTSYPSPLPQMPSLLLNVSPVLFPTLLSTQTIGVPLLAIGPPLVLLLPLLLLSNPYNWFALRHCFNRSIDIIKALFFGQCRTIQIISRI